MKPTWIKLRDDIDTDPRVLRIARLIAKTAADAFFDVHGSNRDLLRDAVVTPSRCVTRDVTVASLRRLWCDVARHGRYVVREDESRVATLAGDLDTIDALTGYPGFGKALAAVGWVLVDEVAGSLVFPNFLEYNVLRHGSKQSSAAKRQAEYRRRLREKRQHGDAAGDAPVTPGVTSPVTLRDASPPPQIEMETSQSETNKQRARAMKGWPATEEAARSIAVTIGVPPDYAATVWHEIEGRGGADGNGLEVVNFASHVKARWNHRAAKKSEAAPARKTGQEPTIHTKARSL